MRIIVGSDERTALTDAIIEWLEQQGHELERIGPLVDHAMDWPEVGEQVAQAIVSGAAEDGVACCWTGTGVAMAANKVPGIRAALCIDAETARGARRWDHANLLVLSLRSTSIPVAHEVLQAWFDTPYDQAETEVVGKLTHIDQKYRRKPRTADWLDEDLKPSPRTRLD
jgi:ribose 5-phosphate isomerase B